jgi:hypothetical protein
MKTLFLFLSIVLSPALFAQQVVATSGGTLGNSNGSMSYTIGEGVAATLSKGNTTLTQGFHQTSISVIPGPRLKETDFTISVYPNPTSDMVTVKVDKEDVSGLHFQLFDMNGKLLKQEILLGRETAVSVNHLSNGIYLLRVQDGSRELRTFKIIKQ